MKKRLQIMVSVSTLVILAIGMTAFISIALGQTEDRLAEQIELDNLAIAQSIASLVASLEEEAMIAALQDVCTSVQLPNSGFICIVDSDGRLVAAPEEATELEGLTILPEGSDTPRSPADLPRGRSIIGRGFRGEYTDIIASAPIRGTDLTVLIHQDSAAVGSRTRDSASSLALPGGVITVLLSVFAFFLVDNIVAGYNGRLEQANAGLQQSNRHRSQLIHILCHDLKNPVGAIRSAARLLQSGETEYSIGLIETSAESALHIIENVRQSEALRTGKRMVALQTVDLAACVRTSAAMMKRAFEDKEVALELGVPEGCRAVAEETSMCNSVLNNLLSNALKFSPRGAGVRIEVDQSDDWVTLSVRDSGIGMPPEILDRLFEPTAHTNRPGTEGETGTGFGMPLVKQFVESFGGSVRVESSDRPGADGSSGTTVYVQLRASRSEELSYREPRDFETRADSAG